MRSPTGASNGGMGKRGRVRDRRGAAPLRSVELPVILLTLPEIATGCQSEIPVLTDSLREGSDATSCNTTGQVAGNSEFEEGNTNLHSRVFLLVVSWGD